MKTLSLLFLVLCVCTLSACAMNKKTPVAGQLPDREIAGCDPVSEGKGLELMKRWMRAIEKRDIGVVDLYSEDAVLSFIPATKPSIGRTAIRKVFEKSFKTKISKFRIIKFAESASCSTVSISTISKFENGSDKNAKNVTALIALTFRKFNDEWYLTNQNSVRTKEDPKDSDFLFEE